MFDHAGEKFLTTAGEAVVTLSEAVRFSEHEAVVPVEYLSTGEADVLPTHVLRPYKGEAAMLPAFAAMSARQKDAQRRARLEVETMYGILCDHADVWVNTEELLQRLGTNRRSLRDRAERSGGRIASRTHDGGGYAATHRLDEWEARRAAARMASQSRAMMRRSHEIIVSFHTRPKVMYEQGTLL